MGDGRSETMSKVTDALALFSDPREMSNFLTLYTKMIDEVPIPDVSKFGANKILNPFLEKKKQLLTVRECISTIIPNAKLVEQIDNDILKLELECLVHSKLVLTVCKSIEPSPYFIVKSFRLIEELGSVITNHQGIRDQLIEKLQEYVDFIEICDGCQ